MAKKSFDSGENSRPAAGLKQIISPNFSNLGANNGEPEPKVQERRTTVINAAEDPEKYVLKSYKMKNKHINGILNLVHHLKVNGQTLTGQKEVMAMVLEAGLNSFGNIPERPDNIKDQEKLRKRSNDD